MQDYIALINPFLNSMNIDQSEWSTPLNYDSNDLS